MTRVARHLQRAEQAGERSETVATEEAAKTEVLRQLRHTLAAMDELQIAAGTKTRRELRAERRVKR